ncbi:MAG TPA: ATP synthase F1 subunit gamma [Candidatus Limnocylindria bacterium]
MPSERELRRRVRSIRNIQQLTRAMQLVAASKMRRAQEAVLASRPYEEKLRSVLNDLAPYADPEVDPLLRRHDPVRRIVVVLITTDRGLVGPMNVNLVRATVRFTADRPPATYIAVGRKGIGTLRRMRASVSAEFPGIPDRPTTADTNAIARTAVDEFVGGNADEVHLAFTRFINTLRQEPMIRRLLPLEPETERAHERVLQYLFEPDPVEVLNLILPRFVEIAVYQAILESKASQFSAQMVAMRNATDSAGELIDEITLAANKARQSRITKEMLEIASGAEAMKG